MDFSSSNSSKNHESHISGEIRIQVIECENFSGSSVSDEILRRTSNLAKI